MDAEEEDDEEEPRDAGATLQPHRAPQPVVRKDDDSHDEKIELDNAGKVSETTLSDPKKDVILSDSESDDETRKRLPRENRTGQEKSRHRTNPRFKKSMSRTIRSTKNLTLLRSTRKTKDSTTKPNSEESTEIVSKPKNNSVLDDSSDKEEEFDIAPSNKTKESTTKPANSEESTNTRYLTT
jgi:hypothetical protein